VRPRICFTPPFAQEDSLLSTRANGWPPLQVNEGRLGRRSIALGRQKITKDAAEQGRKRNCRPGVFVDIAIGYI